MKFVAGLSVPSRQSQQETTTALTKANDRPLTTDDENQKALRRFPGHRARFSYDDLF